MSFRRPWQYGTETGVQAFNKEIGAWGDEYILVRADKHFRCPNYQYWTGSCIPDCPICMGLGYIHQYEIHTMRKSLNIEGQYGNPDFLPFRFFCKTNIDIKREDIIIEVIWNADGTVRDIIDEFKIKDTYVHKLSRDQAYELAAATRIEKTRDAKYLRYLQDMKLLGVYNRI